MHYKNGREAKDGDRVVVVVQGTIPMSGILHSTNPGSDTCNGRIAPTSPSDMYVTIKDCLHLDDIAAASIPDSTPK